MEDSAQDGALCLICHEGLLSQVPCALRCGHVYHSVCCHQWFEKGKGECPQCKSKSGRDELLLLDFEVARVQPRSLEEVRKLEAASAEERNQLREELALELEDMEGRSREARDQIESQREAAQECKQKRRELEGQAPALEVQLKQLRADLKQHTLNNANLSAQVDNQNNRQRQARGRHGSRSQDSINEEDPDAKEERRKLRMMRPADRARQLHEAVVSARQQEAEVNKASRLREAASKELEDELNELRKLEARLRTDLRRMKEQEELSAEAAELGTDQRKASPAAPQPAGAPAAKRARQALPPGADAAKQRPGSGGPAGGAAEARGADDIGDEDLLYGGPPVRRSASASVLLGSRPAAAGLGARSTAPAPAVVASLATPSRKQNQLQALFSKRRA
mmetsp:Transcript_25023/g.77847  ORF Transcript_25023/g.77847 Transcript_25023/m.77847 type:complete len:395 (-) Transcript_25023:91-1275(-)